MTFGIRRNLKFTKSDKLDFRLAKIDGKLREKAQQKKIKILLESDPSWKIKIDRFRPLYYLGVLGHEVNIKNLGYLTDKVIKNLERNHLKIGTFGNFFSDEIMITIWDKKYFEISEEKN